MSGSDQTRAPLSVAWPARSVNPKFLGKTGKIPLSSRVVAAILARAAQRRKAMA